jgi:hypothetical protein
MQTAWKFRVQQRAEHSMETWVQERGETVLEQLLKKDFAVCN